ncbi:enoyl-CoA hydratase/isomerase family protein [Sporichthya sp.]|uniref:enoyl-CoA hydratase/isomerase family protein n=1 Tax=Sporichthya sp. TaxID=65475 RepID=UPI0025E515B3|nr:enoyl-CoA hydratase/isomerase family protein [Sporichthya sp.]
MSLIRLARKPVNALDIELLTALIDMVDRELNRKCRALVITGEGPCFCAGIDTKLAAGYDGFQQRAMVTALNQFLYQLYTAAVPTVAAINGHSLAGGLVIPLACDQRVAATGDYSLGLTEVRAGVPYPAIALHIVQAELDPATARTLCLTGRTLSPQGALDNRIVDELCDPEGLVQRAVELADGLAELPAYGRVKEQLRGRAGQLMRTVLDQNTDPMLDGWLN